MFKSLDLSEAFSALISDFKKSISDFMEEFSVFKLSMVCCCSFMASTNRETTFEY